MKKTETSSFGTGKRESHDSSAFYGRSMFDRDSNTSEQATFYQRNLYRRIVDGAPAQLDLGLTSSDSTEWMDKIYCKSAEDMDEIPDNSIALAFTSPPYNVGKEYDDNMSVQGYMELIREVGAEIYRTLVPGGRYIINIANLGRKPYIPLHAWFYDIHMDIGFLPMGEIIWQKARRISGSCAWGSWKSAKSPRLRDIHEYLLVFAKKSFSRPDSGLSTIERDEFLDATLSVWEIKPESAKRVGHPAPFPVELAARVIRLYSYAGDVVLDPFVGSGSTCIAAARNDRHYVGYDISQEYCVLADKNLAEVVDRSGSEAMTIGRSSVAGVKTECTELSLAFGVLGAADPLKFEINKLQAVFEGTLSEAKYSRFCAEFANPTDHELYKKMYRVGVLLRENYPLFKDVGSLKWTGAQKLANTTSVSMDLLVANTPISAKAGSNVVGNQSPYNLFVSIPKGSAEARNSENWYLQVNPEGYQRLYEVVRETGLDHLPPDISDYERKASPAERIATATAAKQLSDAKDPTWTKLYLEFCHEVARQSAVMFNENIGKSMQGNTRSAVLEQIARNFFRMDATQYILGGVERKQEFAVVVPALSDWKNTWKITNIEAVPDLRKKQSVVQVLVSYESKKTKTPKIASFHIEIRWSHEKFRTKPEAKLYKDFKWTDIEFLSGIL
jgi:DNA modification methylase